MREGKLWLVALVPIYLEVPKIAKIIACTFPRMKHVCCQIGDLKLHFRKPNWSIVHNVIRTFFAHFGCNAAPKNLWRPPFWDVLKLHLLVRVYPFSSATFLCDFFKTDPCDVKKGDENRVLSKTFLILHHKVLHFSILKWRVNFSLLLASSHNFGTISMQIDQKRTYIISIE